jgi:hypothetical protein
VLQLLLLLLVVPALPPAPDGAPQPLPLLLLLPPPQPLLALAAAAGASSTSKLTARPPSGQFTPALPSLLTSTAVALLPAYLRTQQVKARAPTGSTHGRTQRGFQG